MAHKKRSVESNLSIEKALLDLDFPLKNKNNTNIYLKLNDSNRNRSQHISKQYHGLTVSDILLIPIALKDPLYVVRDPNHREKKNYYIKRKGTEKILFVKVITKVIDNEKEEIITVFTTNKIKR